MSGGVLAAVIGAIVVVCCIAPIAFFVLFWNRVAGSIGGQPTGEIVSCRISDGTSIGSAQVEYTITNPGPSAQSYVVDIQVVDSSGAQVGAISDSVPTVNAGATARESALIVLEKNGGTSCRITEIT